MQSLNDKPSKKNREESFGNTDRMVHGLGTVHSELIDGHSLEKHLKQYNSDHDKLNFSMLRKTQGIHAPLRLLMERKAASQIQRLPCLPSSNLMLDVLTGQDEMIGFDDILNNYEDSESLIQPQIAIEKKLGLL